LDGPPARLAGAETRARKENGAEHPDESPGHAARPGGCLRRVAIALFGAAVLSPGAIGAEARE
jgi:hypothetical protein